VRDFIRKTKKKKLQFYYRFLTTRFVDS